MEITFHGAVRTVTGSQQLAEVDEVGSWRHKTYAEDILAVLREA
jgi:hypothetical protein